MVQFGFVHTEGDSPRPTADRRGQGHRRRRSALHRRHARPVVPARPASRSPRTAGPSRTRGSRSPTSTAATRRCTSDAAPRTAPSTSSTCPTAPTSSRCGTTTIDYILYSFNVEVSDGGVTTSATRPRRLVHPHPRPRLRRLQRERQARPGRAGRAAVPADHPRARQLADGPGHEHLDHRRHRRLRHPGDLPAGKWLVLEAFDTRYQHHRHHLPGRERERRRRPGSAAWSTWTSCRHRARRRGRLGRAALRPGHQRRDRRHRQLRHDPQRARPGGRGVRGLPARHPGRAGAPLRLDALHRDHGRGQAEHSAGRATRSSRCRSRTPARRAAPGAMSKNPDPTVARS